MAVNIVPNPFFSSNGSPIPGAINTGFGQLDGYLPSQAGEPTNTFTPNTSVGSNPQPITGGVNTQASNIVPSLTDVSTYTPIPGTDVRVILEFPNYNAQGQSALIVLDDVVSLSYSIYRSKPPVIPLGSASATGYGIGTRTVAGSIIRTVFTGDKLTNFQTQCYLDNQTNIANRLAGINNTMPTGLPYKDVIAFMKDDLSPFNIHTMTISESITYDKTGKAIPRTRYETIYGAIIINNGQVYSIEDLITESTFSFQAKAVKSAVNITDYNSMFSNNVSTPTISSLLK